MLSKCEPNLRIGIAGYMGSGKSSCAAACAEITGIRIIDADAEAKLLMEKDTRIRDEISRVFGPKIANSATVNFAALGAAVFASVDEIRKLNGIVHPPLVRRLRELVFSLPGPSILDAALIPLWRIDNWFDSCLWVCAPSKTRFGRIESKTGMPLEQIKQRMLVQESLFSEPSGSPWTPLINEGSVEELKDSVGRFISASKFFSAR
jgi:dephospho-CoA kinase